MTNKNNSQTLVNLASPKMGTKILKKNNLGQYISRGFSSL